MADNGVQPPGTAEKQLGEIVSDVTAKAQLLVREEIELAKAEIQLKVSRIVKGVAAFAAAGFFALMMLIFLLHTLSWGFSDWLDLRIWVGFAITTGLLLLIVILSALIGLRLFKKGTPPTPEYAIAEAQATKKALDEARS
jgi:hypothetical protein